VQLIGESTSSSPDIEDIAKNSKIVAAEAHWQVYSQLAEQDHQRKIKAC
jgi:hypothetical protein